MVRLMLLGGDRLRERCGSGVGGGSGESLVDLCKLVYDWVGLVMVDLRFMGNCGGDFVAGQVLE